MIRLGLCIFGKKTSSYTHFSVYHIGSYIIVIHLIFGDVNLSHLGKVLFTRFLHWKLLFFPLLLVNILGKIRWDWAHILCISKFLPTILVFTHGSCLQWLLHHQHSCVPVVWFSVFILLHIGVTVRKSCPFLPIYLFNYLLVSAWALECSGL